MRGSFSDDYINNIRLNLRQLSLVRKIGEYLGKQELFKVQTPDVLETMRRSAIIESTESSNRIEGIIASREVIQGIAEKNIEPSSRSENEIAGYKKALDLIHESHSDMPVTSNLILQIHGVIHSYLPNEGGRWKSADNSIIETDVSGLKSVRFKPVSALETAIAMDDLVLGFRDHLYNKQTDHLIIIPLFILDFLCIHPFGDGNGRSSRLLTLLLLYQRGYEVGRYISLERIIEQSKDGYYAALHRSSQGWHNGTHNPMPWVEYFLGVLVAAHKEYAAKVDGLNTGNKGDRVKEFIERLPDKFSVKDITSGLDGVGRDTIKMTLKELKKEGKIISTGRGRSARWIKK